LRPEELIAVKDGTELHFFTHPLRAPLENQRLTDLMNQCGLRARVDYLADKGRTRVLHYPAPAKIEMIVALVARVFVEVYQMQTDDELVFSLK
jgi:hypothetical protein